MRTLLPRLLLLLCLGASDRVQACCAVAPRGTPAVNGDQAVIILWDKERQTEHFIRKASFRSAADSVGFIVPTPTRPQLEESGNEAFRYLAQITAPKPMRTFGRSGTPQPAAVGGVRVVEEKMVAGYDTVVLTADSGEAMTQWLEKHGYAYTAEAAAWAQPYLKKGWHMTAMKIAKDARGRAHPALTASALRISFKTDRPLFPYREPDSREAAANLGATGRLLRVYFLAESRYEGRFSPTADWSGKPKWSQPLAASQRAQVLRQLDLPASTGPSEFWLTEFEDRWAYGKAPGDVYFSPANLGDRALLP